MPVIEQVLGVGELEPALATREERGEQRLEVGGHVGEGGGEDADDLGVDGPDHLGQLAAALLHVVELLLEELVALLERLVLLEGQRVDRAHDPQLALELADAGGGVGAVGELGALGGHGDVGLDVEVAADGLDRGLDAHLDLGLLDLGPLEALALLGERLLLVGAAVAELVELGGHVAGGLGLAAAALAEVVELLLDDRAAVGDERAEALEGGLGLVELLAAGRGGFALGGGALEAALDLGQAAGEELAALGDGRRCGPRGRCGGRRRRRPAPRAGPGRRPCGGPTRRARCRRPRARAAGPRARRCARPRGRPAR